ncbi:MAG: hypothetical protein K6G57_07140 [Lachnospiraceae bacterium]|nr:hypothetical protein [Lachnospiraceae bacterium]
MPFIDSKLTMELSSDQKDSIKTKLGKAVSILNKPESYLMVGIEDKYDLYFAGKKLDKGAYVSVSLFGDTRPDSCRDMTAEICKILSEELGIPGNSIYVTYHGVHDWGWNGSNF